MIEKLLPGMTQEPSYLDALSCDFGKMAWRKPAAAAMPKTVEDLSTIVRWAADNRVRLAIRGGGHSQGGQTLSDGGVSIDTIWLNRIELPEPDLLRAQGGARWGRIVNTLRGTGRLPCVLTDTPDVTVGGTLAAGGVGTTSHRFGMQIGQIERLEVVIGTGERIECSRTLNSDLFDAVRSGQGQFGIVTEAWIRLRKAGKNIRQYSFRYDDFERFASDFERIAFSDRFDHLRAEMRSHNRTVILEAGIEYEDGLDDGAALGELGYDDLIWSEDKTDVGRAYMFPWSSFSRAMYHPWRDWLLPWEALRTVLAQQWVDPDWLPPLPEVWTGIPGPRSWTGIYPVATGTIDAPLFMRPGGERMIGYSILPMLEERAVAEDLTARLRKIDRTLAGLGGKAYLSGGVAYDRSAWERHYGEMFETGRRWKREFDPKGVFGFEGMPFAD